MLISQYRENFHFHLKYTHSSSVQVLYNIVTYEKKIYIWSFLIYIWSSSKVPISQFPKPLLWIDSDLKYLFCADEVTFKKAPTDWGGEGRGCQCSQLCKKIGTHNLLGGKRKWRLSSVTKGQRFNQSCFCNEASIKIQKDEVQRTSRLVNMGRFGRRSIPKSFEAPALSSYLSLCISSIWLFLCYGLLIFFNTFY